MFESKHEPLLPRKRFFLRFVRSIAVAAAFVFPSWCLGILGYHFFVQLSWLDATLNAAMILTGMGPVNPIETVPGKLFASFYALFSGVVFITTAGVLLAPLAHRIIHRFHLEMDPERKHASGEKAKS
jgi:hypothetical protein